VWFYLNPIFYSLTFVPRAFQGYYILNPFVGVATSFQALILPSEQLHLPALTVSIGETLIIGFLGIWLFKKREKYFADWV
jgi:lipopolysaccharide transport system permease protein